MIVESKKINIVIADDHQMFLEGLSALLKNVQDINIVGTVINGSEALEFIENNEVDILIMDLSMPGMDGIELNGIVKKKYPEIKTLALSTHSDPGRIARLTKNKVNGYLLKNAERSELLNAIYALQNGEKYFSEEVKEKVMNSMFSSDEDWKTPELSKREKEILRLIAEEYTAYEIAEKLFISQHTVNTHRKNLLSKLNVKNVAGLVKYAFENGLAD